MTKARLNESMLRAGEGILDKEVVSELLQDVKSESQR